VLIQARRLGDRTVRLPEAGGPRSGTVVGTPPALRLVVIGDSTAVGTGVTSLEEALPGALARQLSRGRAVEWRVFGNSGDTSGEVLAGFGAEIDRSAADIAVLLVGWNDARKLRSGRTFGRDLDTLLTRIAAASPAARIVVVAPPLFGRFAVLPQPLRWALGAQADGLARVARRVTARRGADLATGFDGRSVASDGFHPDARGYESIAASVVRALG
jgi:lysophospholipase L1-like esterase